jgi:hypothetical protein
MEYNEFRSEACENLKKIQDSFMQNYDVNSYSNWYYTQATELLHFYNRDDSNEVYFKYIPIGSYSTKSETWMWSWENEHSIEESKFKTLKLKEFGEKHNFEKLSKGYFKSDEYDGWDFMGIALTLLGGIGAYRVPGDNLLKYFLVVDKVKLSAAKAIENKLIKCSAHGPSRRAYICQHLNTEKKIGFEEAFTSYRSMGLEEEEDFQAWCDECEKVRLKHDGWNAESMKFASIKLVCEVCYFDIKKINLG